MEKLRLVTIVGTRPEIIRLSEVIKACDRAFDHTLVHTGQNYDYALNEIFFKEFSLRPPDRYMDAVGEDLGETLGNIIAKSYKLLAELRPQALLILGDTNSALAAISAKRLKIPIFHMEAGNRCFDENLPEELNRRIVDHTADVNLCYSEHARRYLLREGRPPERSYVTGSPIPEVLAANESAIESSSVLEELALEPGRFILLSAHREENIDIEAHFDSLMAAVNALAAAYDMPIIYSMHPRSRKWIEERGFAFHPHVRSLPPFGFHAYNKLQKNAYCVVSDSGTLPEEAATLHFPAVCIRTSTERPEALEKGSFILGGIETEGLLQAVSLAVALHERGDHGDPVADYQDRRVSSKVVRIVQGYTGIVNKMVWRK